MPASSTTRYGTGSHGPSQHGSAGPAEPFTADSPTRASVAHLENGDEIEQAYRAKRRADRRERRQLVEERTLDLEDRLYEAAMGIAANATGTQVLAGRVLHAIWNGQPVGKTDPTEPGNDTITIIGGLPDDDIIPHASPDTSPNPA